MKKATATSQGNNRLLEVGSGEGVAKPVFSHGRARRSKNPALTRRRLLLVAALKKGLPLK
jgi:hypothetical protein